MQNLKLKTKSFGYILFVLWIYTLGATANAAIISNVELTSVSDNSVVITWSTTDEASTTEIEWGIGGLGNVTTVSGTTKYHYAEITGLYAATNYQYRVKSGSTRHPAIGVAAESFKTLSRPSGEYLFSIAAINDLLFAENKANHKGARGVPYQYATQTMNSQVTDINEHDVAFTVVNGNIADAGTSPSTENYTNQIDTNLKAILEQLDGANDLPSGAAYKYLPVTGYHDKLATYAGAENWITKNFNPLTTDTGTTESRYGYTTAQANTNGVFNYQFRYKYYNFIFLDAINANGGGSVDLAAVNNYLSAESNSKAFIFMSYPGYDPFADETQDYPIAIPTSEVAGALNIANHAAFQSTIEAYEDTDGNPIVGAVISGHLNDNYMREINDIAYLRQGPALAFPTGYSIYKVYSNGFIKTFYKTQGRDANDKPYYELARDQISSETISGTVLPAEVMTQFWLGSNSMRNFTITYPFIPGISPRVLTTTPTSGESGVNLNKPIVIDFNKRMLEQDLNNWVSISPSAGTITARFLDADRTILLVNHSQDFVEGEVYTVTVSASKAKDEGSTPMASDHVFTFDTSGGTKDEDPPSANIDPLAGNVSTDPFPTFLGSVSDESNVINIEYRVDNTGAWITAEALDGTFNASIETFKIEIASPLDTGVHQIWLRTTDGANNVNADGSLAYTFTIAGEEPTIAIQIDEAQALAGDPISPTPVIEIVITSINDLQSARLNVDDALHTLNPTQVDINYYATYEVTTALADGTHRISVEATDTLGQSTIYEIYPLYVQSAADTTVQGTPLNYPNPFDPGTSSTTISYTLSKPSNITLNILDLSGNLVAKKTYTAGTTGGKVGYNEISWDGKSDSGNYVGTGIYVYLIIVDGKVTQNGKGKITVFKL